MSIFSDAKSVKKTAAKKSEKERIGVTGLENYAVVDKVVKAFTALQKTLGEEVKDEMVGIFAGIGKQTKKRPENFTGFEGGDVTASCELRCRPSNSPLTDEEVDLLTAADIPFQEVPETYLINPAYSTDASLLEKVAKALESVKGLPEDFILKQDGKRVASAESIDKVFEKGLATSLLPLVVVPAVKPVVGEKITLVDALERVKKLAGLATEAETKKKTKK